MPLLLSLRMLVRDWRSGELRVLALALLLAVAGITSVGFFTDRVRLALERQAGDLLGADLVLSAGQPIVGAVAAPAAAGLRRARSVEFPSMAISATGSTLASLRAVSAGYPLRGTLRISDARFAPDRPAASGPEQGTVWVEARALDLLAVEVGDALTLGDADFRIAAVLTSEPLANGGGMLFGVAPRVLLSLDDLDATGLARPGSRLLYRYLFAGEPAGIERFRREAEQRLALGERIERVEDAQPQVRTALERARSFLSLAALVSVLLAGVAVAIAARRFIARHLDGCAVMRCLGARQDVILRLYGLQLLWLGLIAAVLGSALGYGAQYGLERVLGGMVQIDLPAPSLRPLLLGFATALITLLGFALPPLLHLRNVPALRVMRRELGGMSGAGFLVYAAGAGAIAALVLWHSADPRLGGYIMAGTLLALAALAVLALALLGLLRLVYPRLDASWRFGLLGLIRRPGTAVIQLMAFGLGLTVLLLLALVRGDLMDEWERGLPENAPNRFLINIQGEQIAPLRAFFAGRGLDAPAFFPMVRGRLTAIGERAVAAEDYEEDRARNLVRREFNLSWAETMQEDNRIVAGRWWSEHGGGAEVSVEQGLAETLGIALGDRLVFAIGGSEVAVTVSSLRTVEWDSFRVNFFVIAPPGVFDAHAGSYISSLYVPADGHGMLNDMVRAFPNVTVLDVAAIMDHVRGIMERVAAAVEYVFMFTLLAGLLVMYAAVHATLDERIRDTVLLRTLGASRAQLLRGLVAEFVALGLLAGLAAATLASLLGYLISTRVLDLRYAPGWELWAVGALAGALGVGIAGIAGTRFVLGTPPVRVLREAL
jgi:putative ABC transport system permease protein